MNAVTAKQGYKGFWPFKQFEVILIVHLFCCSAIVAMDLLQTTFELDLNDKTQSDQYKLKEPLEVHLHMYFVC